MMKKNKKAKKTKFICAIMYNEKQDKKTYWVSPKKGSVGTLPCC